MGKILYIDESGDIGRKLDPLYPVFALGGVIVDEKDVAFNAFAVNEFKKKWFGHTEVILHSLDITHKYSPFDFLLYPKKQKEFYESLNDLMKSLRYGVIASIVDKRSQILSGEDIYREALSDIICRFADATGQSERGNKIIAEEVGKNISRLAYFTFNNRKNFFDADLEIHQKSANIIGLQIADLVLPPIVRNYLGKKNNQDYEIISERAGNNGIMIINKVKRGDES